MSVSNRRWNRSCRTILIGLLFFMSGRSVISKEVSLFGILGHWKISDAKYASVEKVQVDNINQLKGVDLDIFFDRVDWPRGIEALSSKETFCQKPALIPISGRYSAQDSFKIACGNGGFFGNLSIFILRDESHMEMSWFDNEILILSKVK